MRRLRRALRTNDEQVSAVVAFTAINLSVLLVTDRNVPWWLWIVALVIWPTMVLFANTIDPIP